MGRVIGCFFIVLSYLIGISTPILSQDVDLENFVVTQYGMNEGLPQSSVNDIIQTDDGYLWLATYGGLVRFDGNSFTTYNRSNTPGMIADRIIMVFEDADGGIWHIPETSRTELMRLKDGKVESYSLGEDFPTILQMYLDERGVIWLSAYKKLYRFDNNKFVQVTVSNDENLTQEALDYSDGVWIGTEKKILLTFSDEAFQIYDLNSYVDGDIISVIEYPKGSGILFAGTNTNGVLRINGNDIREFNTDSGMPSNNFLSFNITESGDLYAHFFASLVRWEDDSFKLFDPLNIDGLQYDGILEDNEGNLWIGTEGEGLFKLQKSAISMIDKDQGLQNEKMLSLTMLHDGTALFSTNCGGLYHWKDNKATVSKIQEFFPSGCNWSVFEDSRNRIWVGGGGVYVTNSMDEPGQYFGNENGFTNAGVFAISEDSKGNIWVSSSEGLYVFNGDSIINTYRMTDGLYYLDIRAIYEDEVGRMWLGSAGGLNTIFNDQISKVELIKTDGSTNNSIQPTVRAIYQDSEGVMWIGSYGNGLFRIKNGKIVNLTTSDGLFDNVISTIEEDKQGFFWMGSNRGISQVSRRELNEYIDGNLASISIHSFGTNDGMNSAETNGGFQPNTFSDSLGNIYFPTVAGVAVVSPNKMKNNEIIPPVYIENLRLFDTEIALSGSISLEYNTPFLEIRYTAISFTEPDKVQFKYRLHGLDDNWIEIGNTRKALYSRIPPGEYTFQVIASNNDGFWNNEGASIKINVIPPFWQTTWFLSLIGLIFLTSGPSIYFYRIKLLKKENERQKQFAEQLIDSQENERKRIASELHDGLGQQILVIKNRAELAKQLINKPEELNEQLNEIMQSSILSIQEVRTISHALRPVYIEKFGLTEAIENLCEQLTEISSIEWSYHIDNIDNIIPQSKEINFYRVIQEGTNNILKHSSAIQASVLIKLTKEDIQVKIWDDGVGFEQIPDYVYDGLGFLGMKERVENLRGTFTVNSKIGSGTTLKIELRKQSYE